MPNTQRRIIYIGYWLVNADIPALVAQWRAAAVTHIVMGFVTHLFAPDPRAQPVVDLTRPVSVQWSGVSVAFFELTPANQQLMTSNFVVGISYGGAAGMPHPFSDVFAPGSYYAGKPELLAADIVAHAGGLRYFDLDVEGIAYNKPGIDHKYPETVDFLGRIGRELKRLVPGCTVSHAPQSPYFHAAFGSVYSLLYRDWHAWIDFFSIQFYNQSMPYTTYDEIFVRDPEYHAAVLELQAAGIEPSYLVVGKVVASDASSGFVAFPQLLQFFRQAFADPRLAGWQRAGGIMIWFYYTQLYEPKPVLQAQNAETVTLFSGIAALVPPATGGTCPANYVTAGYTFPTTGGDPGTVQHTLAGAPARRFCRSDGMWRLGCEPGEAAVARTLAAPVARALETYPVRGAPRLGAGAWLLLLLLVATGIWVIFCTSRDKDKKQSLF